MGYSGGELDNIANTVQVWHNNMTSPRFLRYLTGLSSLLLLVLGACSSTQVAPTATVQPTATPRRLVGGSFEVPATKTPAPIQPPVIQSEATATPAAASPDTTGNVATAEADLEQITDGFNVNPPPLELADLAAKVFGGNLPTRLVIPRIELDTIIIPVGWRVNEDDKVEWDSPANAAGFLVSSAAPGQEGNSVIYGHNNILGEAFKNLDQLQPDDIITVANSGGGTLLYVVEAVEIIEEAGITPEQKAANLAYFDPTEDTRLTLLTCWPYTSNSHRVVIIARPQS